MCFACEIADNYRILCWQEARAKTSSRSLRPPAGYTAIPGVAVDPMATMVAAIASAT
jgi:hypothetical protein